MSTTSEKRFEVFLVEFEQLCAKHDVYLETSGNDILTIWDGYAQGTVFIHNNIEETFE